MPDETPTQGSEAADGVRLLASLIAPTGDEDIMALVLEVLNAAAREAREDLKQIMEQVRAMTAAKRALRELINKVNRDVTANAHRDDCEEMIFADRGLGGEAAYHDVGFPVADVEAEGGVRFARVDLHKGAITSVREVSALQDELRSKLDSLSEMGEMESLRLQMAMDRLSKLMQTLSNLLKKASDTQSAIIQNLK